MTTALDLSVCEFCIVVSVSSVSFAQVYTDIPYFLLWYLPLVIRDYIMA